MERVTITICPSPDETAKLRVREAMQQVIDTIALHEEAARDGDGSIIDPIDWRLERATTQSPFTVVALAESGDPTVDIAPRAREIKAKVSHGMRDIIEHKRAPAWMGPVALDAVKNILLRHALHAFSSTTIDFDDSDTLSINDALAHSGLDTIDTLRAVIDTVANLPAQEAYGEVEGALVAVGRSYNKPAVQIFSHLYGFIWCVLPRELIDRFGGEHLISEVWEGKTVAVDGRLFYAAQGKLNRVEARDVREVKAAPRIDLDSVLDPDFTSGLSPGEYLDKLHDGDLG